MLHDKEVSSGTQVLCRSSRCTSSCCVKVHQLHQGSMSHCFCRQMSGVVQLQAKHGSNKTALAKEQVRAYEAK